MADLPTYPGGKTPVLETIFTDARGAPVLVTARFHEPDDKSRKGYKKRFSQHTRDPETGKWRAKNPQTNPDGTPRLNPILDLPLILRREGWPVLVVEGEMKCREAQKYLPDGWVVTCWTGGANAVKKTDWEPLKGRLVAVWPDNDIPGISAAHEIGTILGDVRVIVPPEGAGDKWDLADALPEGVTPEHIEGLIARSLDEKPVEVQTPVKRANGHAVVAAPESKIVLPKFKALGYRTTDSGVKIYFISLRTQNIISFSSQVARSGNGLRDLEPDMAFWFRNYGKDGQFDWKAVADDMIAHCYRVGLYNEQKVRSRGVWLDSGRVVAHLGNKIIVDGVETPPMGIEGEYIYPMDERLLPDSPDGVPALTDEEGKRLMRICSYPEWSNKTSGRLLAGVIATSCICGSLKFRTHAWLTGPAGSGKSYIMENVVARALKGTALHIMANSSEAGIRRHLSRDARPAIYDEAEGEGKAGEDRRNMIIAFMRASSTETEARILLGSGGTKGESFPVRAQFILGSVGIGIERTTDQTRCLVLSLRGRSATTQDEREYYAERFAMLQNDLAAMPEYLSERLLKRMMGLVHIVRANAERFRLLISQHFSTSRIGDQLGTILAGAYALRSDKEVSDSDAMAFLKEFPWDEYTLAQDIAAQDEGSLLNHLASQPIRVEKSDHAPVVRVIGEVCMVASRIRLASDCGVDIVEAKRALDRSGIWYDEKRKMFWLANNHPELRKIFSTSQFKQGYQEILMRVSGADKSPHGRSFAGAPSARGIMIPVDKLAGSDVEIPELTLD